MTDEGREAVRLLKSLWGCPGAWQEVRNVEAVVAALSAARADEREACADEADYHVCKKGYGLCDCGSEIGKAIRARKEGA